MAELAAISSIFGIVENGAKLSIMLSEFGSAMGSAGPEVKAIGTEVSLFCAVLKQLHSTLTKAKAFRYSISAIDTTQTILDRCQQIFKDIENILDGLGKRKAGGEPSIAGTMVVSFRNGRHVGCSRWAYISADIIACFGCGESSSMHY